MLQSITDELHETVYANGDKYGAYLDKDSKRVDTIYMPKTIRIKPTFWTVTVCTPSFSGSRLI